MKGKRFLSLVISAAMTLTTFSGLAMTSASAEVGDVANEIWNAATYDGAIIADTALYEGDKGTLTTKFDMTKYTTYTENEAEVPVSETVGERTFTAYYSHPSMNGGYNTGGTYRDGYMTLFTFTPKSDGVMTLYLRNVGSNKSVAILKEGATNYKAISTDGGTTGSIVWQTGTGASASYSAQLTANTTYLMFVDGSKGQFMAVDYEVGATYEQATPPPATPTPTHDPNAKSWAVSDNDKGIKAGTTLMVGLTTLFDNTSTSNKYISGADNGKIDKNAATQDAIVTGTALKFVAPENGRLEATMIDVGSENADGTIKQVTPVIFDLEALQDVFSKTNTTAKETVDLWADVEEGKTYYITATGTKGRFSAAKFTPASEVTSTDTPSTGATDTPSTDATNAPSTDATNAPSTDATNAPSTDATDAPSTNGITYAGDTVTVTLDDTTVTSGVLLHAKYKADKTLDSVETAPLTFTDGVATVPAKTDLKNDIENGDKLMAWDSLNGMKPLCATLTVTVGGSVTPGETTAPGENTPAPTKNPDGLPDDVIFRADDTVFDAYNALGTADHAGGTYGALTIGDSYHMGSKTTTYTHTDGKTYTFTRAWQGGTGNSTIGTGSSRNLSFQPEGACVVTVVFDGNGNAGRTQSIAQNGTVLASVPSEAGITVVTADILDYTAGPVVVYGGGSNKNVYAIFVEYYDATPDKEITGTVDNATGEDLTGSKLVFTNTNSEKADDVVEVDLGTSYAAKLTKGETYQISVKGKESTICPTISTSQVTVTKNRNAQTHDIKLVKIENVNVTGTVSTLLSSDLRTPVKAYDSAIGATINFTKDGDTTPTSATVGADGTYTVSLLTNENYTVTLTGTEDYTLSPLSASYELPGGVENPYKNILLMKKTALTVDYKETVTVGTGKDYPTISDAVAAIRKMSRTGNQRVTILVDPGTYTEQVIVDVNNVTLKSADTSNPAVVSWYYGIGYEYYSAATDGWYNADAAVAKTLKGTAQKWGGTVYVRGTGFLAENIKFQNSFNLEIVSQELSDGVASGGADAKNYDRTANAADPKSRAAVERAAAMLVEGANAEFYQCSFQSSQDTLWTGTSSAYFKECDIYGGTDYIFGGNSVVFDTCNLIWQGYSDQQAGGYITACKNSSTSDNGYLLVNCTVKNNTADSDQQFAQGGYGRNWGGVNCKVIFLNTKLEGDAKVAGWTQMGGALADSNLYVVNTLDKDGNPVALTSDDTPCGTLTAEQIAAIDPYDYFNNWTPAHYVGDVPEATEYVTNWYFGKSNGAADYPEASVTNIHEIEGENNAETTQTMIVDKTNGGKLSNEGRNDEWANVGTGTKMTIPVVKGSVISFGSYQNSGEITINGTVVAGTGTYTVTEDVKTIEITVSKGGYMSYVRTTTPAANGKPEDYIPPVLSGTVSITGDVKFGSKVTASVDDANVDGLKYQWQANTGENGAYVDITGATSAEYTIAADYIGKTLKCVVTSDKATGSISKETTAVAKADMTGTVTIGGTPKFGVELTADVTSSNAEEATLTYKWLSADTADGTYSAIDGATSKTYTPVAADVGKYLKCEVGTTDTNYTGTVSATTTTAVVKADMTGTVTIGGTVQEGQTVTATISTNAGNDYTIQWQVSDTNAEGGYANITDATKSSFAIPETGYAGKTLKCVVTSTSSTVAGSVTSDATSAILAKAVETPAITGTVSVTGNAVVGQKLTATVANLNEGATEQYQWQASTGTDGAYENISGATSSTYTISANLVGKTIKCVVTTGTTTGSIESTATAAVVLPTLAGTAKVIVNGDVDKTEIASATQGTTVEAVVTTEATGTLSYKWYSKANAEADDNTYTEISGATLATYAIPADTAVGTVIKVVVSAEGYTGTITSNTVAVSAQLPESKWSEMGGADETAGTIEVVKEGSDYVDVLTVKAGKSKNFTYDLAADIKNFPATYAAADGEIVVSYDLKIDSATAPTNDWFMDLSTANTSISGWNGGDNALFGRMTGHQDNRLNIIAAAKGTLANPPERYNNGNGFVKGEWKTVTFRIDLKTKSVFTASYGDDGVHTVVGYPTSTTDKKLYMNIGLNTAPADHDVVAKIKNLTATYNTESPSTYTVSDGDSVTGGTLSYSPTSARAGETVTVTGTPTEQGGIITSLTASEGLNVTKQDDTHYTFIMPAKNVTVDATMQVARIITVPTVTDFTEVGGTVTCVSSSPANQEVTITATPYEGYKVSGYSVVDTATKTPVDGVTVSSDGKFTMPNQDITVNATFVPADNTKILMFKDMTYGSDTNDNFRIANDNSVKLMNYAKSSILVKFDNVDFTNLKSVKAVITKGYSDSDLIQLYSADQINDNVDTSNTDQLGKDSAGRTGSKRYKTDYLNVKADTTPYASVAAANREDCQTANNVAFSKFAMDLSTAENKPTGTAPLYMYLTNPAGNAKSLGNCWYVVLEYNTAE